MLWIFERLKETWNKSIVENHAFWHFYFCKQKLNAPSSIYANVLLYGSHISAELQGNQEQDGTKQKSRA